MPDAIADAGATNRPVPPLLPQPGLIVPDAEPLSGAAVSETGGRRNPFAGVRVRLVSAARRSGETPRRPHALP